MLRLMDARAGSLLAVRPARPRLLLVRAHVPGTARGSDVTGLRVLLTADLLFRAAELDNLQALTTWAFPGRFPGQAEALRRAAGTFGIHPPAGSPVGPADVHVAGHEADVDESQGGIVVPVAAARGQGGVLAGDGPEPLAVRLALLSCPYDQPADLSGDVLASAGDALGHWRCQVARWAESPSRPMPPGLAAAVKAAFGDLDTVALFALLRGLDDDDGVPPGAKFETFVYADRVLGLDLPRDIGH